MPGSRERTSSESTAGRTDQSVGGKKPRKMRVPRMMAASEADIKAGSGGGRWSTRRCVEGEAGEAFCRGGRTIFGRKFRGGLKEGSEDREFQSWAVVIRHVVSDAEGVEFVPHVSGGHGVFGGAPGFGEVKDALGRRVPRFGGH